MPNESKVQLLLERAIKALIVSYQTDADDAASRIFPVSFPIYCAHEASTRDETKPDYLDLIAGFPLFDGGSWGVPVTFQLLTGIADQDSRALQTDLHATRQGALRDLWSVANFRVVLALMNAPIVAGIGFTGWTEIDGGEDGPDESGTQLVTRSRYRFDCHLL